MRLRLSVFNFRIPRCFPLFGLLLGLTGCGDGRQSPDSPVPLPADASFNTSVRSTGYSITDLGPGTAIDINSSGQVLGSASHAYLWTEGRRHYLGILLNDTGGSDALSLNDSGQALGVSFGKRQVLEAAPVPSHPFVWQNGKFTPLTDGSAVDAKALKINNAGQVLLVNTSASAAAGALWQAGQITPISAIGKSGKPLELVSMNNRGQIIARGSDSPDTFTTAPVPLRSYLVQNGQVTDLGALPDRQITLAAVINDNQLIVGAGGPLNSNDPNLPFQAFMWQNRQIAVLNALPNVQNDLNNSSQIVGWIQDASIARRYAYLYDLKNRTLVDLDATVGKPAGWKLESATAINDRGQIIGEGLHNGQFHSYLLTPL